MVWRQPLVVMLLTTFVSPHYHINSTGETTGTNDHYSCMCGAHNNVMRGKCVGLTVRLDQNQKITANPPGDPDIFQREVHISLNFFFFSS
jgi:hypothetical protein